MRNGSVLIAAACCALALGCRDGRDPFANEPRPPATGNPLQLTFSAGHDLNPTWSRDSDTVYYSGMAFIDYPQHPSSLLRIARSGGIAQLIAPDAQRNVPTNLVLPVASPQGDRVAYVQMGFMNQPTVCANVLPLDIKCSPEPLLETATLRVRPATATAAAGLDPGIGLVFKGADPARSAGGVGPYVQRLFPFQAAYLSAELLFRPTWAPDGQRIAFSDGLNIHIWNTAQPASVIVPNTQDGVSAAWNRAGDRIAFARLERGDSASLNCSCALPGDSPTSHKRWTYTVTRSVIVLVNPDGSDPVEIAEGQDPAWSPDGSTVYFTYRGDDIFRVSRNGGAATIVPGTRLGRSPSVSPDGRWLAFTRGSTTNQNVWVLSLDSQTDGQ